MHSLHMEGHGGGQHNQRYHFAYYVIKVLDSYKGGLEASNRCSIPNER